MRKLVVLVFALLFAPVYASAQEPVETPPLKIDWKLITFIATGQGADLVSTVRFLNNGSGCVERNPVIGHRPSHTKLVVVKASVIALNIAAVVELNKAANNKHLGPKKRKFARVTSKILGYSVGTWGAATATYNIAGCGW